MGNINSNGWRVAELLNQRNHSRLRDLNLGSSADPTLPDTMAGLFILTHGYVPAVSDHLRNTINFLSEVGAHIFIFFRSVGT